MYRQDLPGGSAAATQGAGAAVNAAAQVAGVAAAQAAAGAVVAVAATGSGSAIGGLRRELSPTKRLKRGHRGQGDRGDSDLARSVLSDWRSVTFGDEGSDHTYMQHSSVRRKRRHSHLLKQLEKASQQHLQ